MFTSDTLTFATIKSCEVRRGRMFVCQSVCPKRSLKLLDLSYTGIFMFLIGFWKFLDSGLPHRENPYGLPKPQPPPPIGIIFSSKTTLYISKCLSSCKP